MYMYSHWKRYSTTVIKSWQEFETWLCSELSLSIPTQIVTEHKYPSAAIPSWLWQLPRILMLSHSSDLCMLIPKHCSVSKGMWSPTYGEKHCACFQIGRTMKDGHHTAVAYGGYSGNSESSDTCVYVCLTWQHGNNVHFTKDNHWMECYNCNYVHMILSESR